MDRGIRLSADSNRGGGDSPVERQLPDSADTGSGGPALGAQIAVGAAAALIAVAIRYSLPLSPIQLPTLTVVVAVALVSTFIGTAAGVTAAIVGGLASWWLLFLPSSGGLTLNGAIPLFGFAVIAGVIVTALHLYRRSERRYHGAQLAILKERAEAADRFALEQAHRLKNAMAIVQSIAFQTLDPDGPGTAKFAARLKAIADVHDLLSAHVDAPTAALDEVVQLALAAVAGDAHRIALDAPPVRIAGQQALILTLALHELADNAVTHGALAVPGGRVSLTGSDLGDRVELDWKESGGPVVAPAPRPGFGARYLEKIGSGTELLFEPDGVRARLFLRRGAGG